MHGGGHERGMRSGTLPTHQIVGMGEAFRIAKEEMADEMDRIRSLRDRLWNGTKDMAQRLQEAGVRVVFVRADGKATTVEPKVIDSFSGQHDFLSNFYPSQVEFEGVSYRTVEHAYQAAKTLHPQLRRLIAAFWSPGQAKHAGRKLELRSDWEEVKVEIMEGLVRVKFADPRLAVMLRETGDVELIEGNTWGDTFWGMCKGKGRNELGKILMKARG